MVDLWWTDLSLLETEKGRIPVDRAVTKYHWCGRNLHPTNLPEILTKDPCVSFLDLMTLSTSVFLVPTLDIDLAWHTHQLSSIQYRNDCTKYIGRFVDQ
jgi:hypothetical protein